MKIKKVVPAGNGTVFDIGVKDYHNYIVKGVCTHNSSDPNLQNIPSRGPGKEIRKLFTATPGYVLVGSDFSAQEPRIMTHMSQDEKMLKAYNEGKDLYCEIASISFGVPYEECKEFNADGTTNKEGKERRT